MREPRTFVATFTPSTSGTYTFTVSSNNFYCYVCVVDPRSTDIGVYGVDMKSAVGGVKNVSLDVELDANVSYLVIMSPEAPSLVDSLHLDHLL